MSKTYYTDYVRHALRFYSRNCTVRPKFKSDSDKNNWLACHSIFKTVADRERDMLLSVYSGYDTLPDEVYNCSKKCNIDQNIIWDLMKITERKIAKKRGLL